MGLGNKKWAKGRKPLQLVWLNWSERFQNSTNFFICGNGGGSTKYTEKSTNFQDHTNTNQYSSWLVLLFSCQRDSKQASTYKRRTCLHHSLQSSCKVAPALHLFKSISDFLRHFYRCTSGLHSTSAVWESSNGRWALLSDFLRHSYRRIFVDHEYIVLLMSLAWIAEKWHRVSNSILQVVVEVSMNGSTSVFWSSCKVQISVSQPSSLTLDCMLRGWAGYECGHHGL